MQPLAVADLQRSGISQTDAERAGMFDVVDASTIYSEFRASPAIVIPYFDAEGAVAKFSRDDKLLPFCRVRYLGAAAQTSFTARKDVRYGQPKGSGTRAYLPPLLPWAAIFEDVNEPLLLTEGEKKGLAGIVAGLPVIALGGVFNFMSEGELLPELEAIKWRGRDVYICFDSDAALNPNILAAEARLVDELQRRRGANCFLVRIPQDGESKVGLDDFIVGHGADGARALLRTADSLGALDER